jgi:tRNA dimethylallyltransferase
MKQLVAIVGPTGIGKSRLALRLAKAFQGEIISADSRQVYRKMNIGTAKPPPEELASVPHRLIDVIDPDEPFSLAIFLQIARKAIDDIQRSGKLPFLVGGTGLYIRAVLEGWQPPAISPDKDFRYNIGKRISEKSADEIYRELVNTDPDAAAKIESRNVRRVTRALEVHAKAGQAFSQLGGKIAPAFVPYIIGLTAARPELYRRVDRRVDEMIEKGLIPEVENLMKSGYDFNLPSMSGIGYKQIGQYLKGELTLEAATQKIKTETHRFIRHQYAWFHLNDEKIHWYDADDWENPKIDQGLAEFLKTEL